MSRKLPLLSLVVVLCLAAAPTQTPAKTALDKPTFEAYVRHLYLYEPKVTVVVDDPKPCELAGFLQVDVHASLGTAKQDVVFYVSKDGQKILQGTFYDVNQNPFKDDLAKLKTDLQPSCGTPGASVVLVEFSDFQCAYCRQEAKVLRDNVLTAYSKQVRLFFVDFPLKQLHPWAESAAMIGRSIFKQNSKVFWDYHDWIFEHQGEITVENLTAKVLEFAQGKEIDTLQLSRSIEAKAGEAELAREMELGKSLKIDSTPTLFINGRRRAGAQDWPTLRTIIDYEIEYQKTAHNAGEDCGCEVKLGIPGAN